MTGSGLVADVYMNRGWWVAMCPRPFCDHAEYFGVATNGAGVGGLQPTHMMCGRCGGCWPAQWPTLSMRRGVEQLLADRPDPSTRNWLPHETLADLLWENVEHGVTPPGSLESAEPGALPPGGGVLLATVGDEVTVGARTLVAAGRLALPGGQ